MRSLKLISAILVVALLCGAMMFSCKPAEEMTVHVKVTKADGSDIIDMDVQLQGDAPTVLDALNAACTKANCAVEMNDAGTTVLRIDGYGEPATAEEEEGAVTEERVTGEDGMLVGEEEAPASADPLANYYWQYTINGQEPSKDSGNLTVKTVEASDIIAFTFVEFVMTDAAQ